MEKEFIPYEQALALKEFGFDEKCGACYYKKFDNEIGYHKVYRDFNFVQLTVSAPTFSQAFRWFRDKYKIDSSVTPCSDGEYIFTLYDLNKCNLEVFVEDIEIMESEDSYDTPEEAELECLKKLIELCKKN